MKKSIIILPALCLLSVSCMTNRINDDELTIGEQAPLTGIAAIPLTDLENAYDFSSLEEEADIDFSSVSVSPLQEKGWYIVADEINGFKATLSLDAEEIPSESPVYLVPMGIEDQALALELNSSGIQSTWNILVDLESLMEQGGKLSQHSLAAMIYTPEQYTYNLSGQQYPLIRIFLQEETGTIHQLGSDCARLSLSDFSSGWYMTVLDFSTMTFDFGNRKGTFYVNPDSLDECKALLVQISCSGSEADLDIPLIIDWIDLGQFQSDQLIFQ